MGIDFDQLRQTFVAETEEDLDRVEQVLLDLEKSPADTEGIAVVFRKIHTLKGNARSLGMARVAELAHALEDLLDRLRSGEEPLTVAHVTCLLRAVDALRGLLPALAQGRDELTPACEALRAQLLDGNLGSLETEAETGPRPAAQETEGEGGAEGARTLRIEAQSLDRLLNMTTEMAIVRSRLGGLIEREGRREVVEAFGALERLSTDLHHSITRIRLVPLAPLLRWQARVVRDTAQEKRKQVEMTVSDEGVEVDTSVVERLRAPLSHIIRNAVSHGIESPATRKKHGKPTQGRIEVRARYEGTGIAVEIEDDGAGFDRKRIVEKAIALGLVSGDEDLSDDRIDRLIFEQGLSTARQISGVSGRGVGMDVVRRHIEGIGGLVDVVSHTGRGSRFTIRMPLTLAIIDGFLVGVGPETYVIPLAGVVRCADFADQPVVGIEDGVVDILGRAVPYVRLRSVLGITGQEPGAEIVVAVEVDGVPLAIVADRLIAKRQVVVKPLGSHLKGLRLFSGLTILGDGKVAPILNVAGLMRGCVEAAQPDERGRRA